MTIIEDKDDPNVVKLAVSKRPPLGETFLQAVPVHSCTHFRGPFEVDDKANKCKCLACGGEVSPFFVLTQLMAMESTWMRNREAAAAISKRLEERTSTKCQHCGKMTRIKGLRP